MTEFVFLGSRITADSDCSHEIKRHLLLYFPHSSVSKESTCNAGDPGLIPGLGRSAGEGKGYPLQYSGLENSMDYTVHGVSESERLSLLLGRKAMTNLDSVLKTKGITLPTKVHIIKAMVFPVVMYGCDSWIIKKLSTKELMLLNCGVGEDS